MSNRNSKKAKIQKIAVIGIGRVGLPFSLVLADEGFEVIGIDKDPNKHKVLVSGKMPFMEDGAEPLLRIHYGKNFILGGLKDLKKCNAIVICVGTFLTDKFTPDLSAVYELLDEIIPHINKNTLLVLRSTVEPHATEQIYLYLQKRILTSFNLVYAPERISEGVAIKELYTLPQIIGSFDDKSYLKAKEIFDKFAPEVIKTDPLTAELAKLVLNTHRYATFALANELMMIVEHFGRNIHDVLNIANKNYVRGHIPGPGFAAGPCLVKDSFFLRFGTPYNTMITGSYAMNENVIEFIVDELKKRMDVKNKKIAVLGLAFKKNIDDDRGSLSLKLIQKLQDEDCNVTVHDSFLTDTKLKDVLKGANALIIAVNHDEYIKLKKSTLRNLTGKKTIVCDIWNILQQNKLFFQL